jgi:hypothetical protein
MTDKIRNACFSVIVFFGLITPLTPKLYIAEGIYMYPLDIVMSLALVPLLILSPSVFTRDNRSLFLTLFWLAIIASTVGSLLFEPSPQGLAKAIKGILYVPLLCIAFICSRDNFLSRMLYVGICAQLANFWVYANALLTRGFSIWDPELLSSGFSNKFIDPSTLSLANIPDQGAHGIWGTYCALTMAIALHLYASRRIGKAAAIFAVALCGLSIVSTVSRESLLVLLMIFFYLLCRMRVQNIIYLVLSVLAVIVLGAALLPMLGIEASSVPLIAKLLYTSDAISSTGEESNIALRLGSWQLIIAVLAAHPWLLLTGGGYNLDLLAYLMEHEAAQAGISTYVPLPEGLFFFGLAFGGLFAVLMIGMFCRNVFMGFWRVQGLKVMVAFFAGLLLTNLLSGASMIADLVYSQMLLVIGALASEVAGKDRVI